MTEFRSSVGLEQAVAENTMAHRAMVESVGAQVEMATPGSPRRRFFDELMSGTSLREALEIPGLDLGAYPERSSALIKAYVDDRRLFEGRAGNIGVSSQDVAAARYVAVRPLSIGDIRAAMQSVGGRKAGNKIFSAPQLEAIRREKARVNAGLPKAAAQVAALEQAGMRGTPVHRLALQDYSNLVAAVVPTGAESISVEKGVAADEALQVLNAGRESKVYDNEALKRAIEPIDQDRGVIGQVRTGQGDAQHGYRFVGWEHDQDVVLNPQHEARVALEMDPKHNADYLTLRAEGGDTPGYYEHIRATHQSLLDQSISSAPKFDPESAPKWLAATGPDGEVLGGDAVNKGNMGLVSRPPMLPASQGETLEGVLVTPDQANLGLDSLPQGPPVQSGNPLVVTADHADFGIHAEEALRQHRAMQSRILVSLGFTAIQGGISFMEASSRWAANPDGGATAYAFGNVMLGLNGVNTSMQTYFQSTDAKDRVFGQLVQDQKEAQGAVGKAYQTKAQGAISQLEAIHKVGTFHAAEVVALDENKALLDLKWQTFQATQSTAIYREIFSQAAQSGNTKLADTAGQELVKLEKMAAAGQAYTKVDFHEAVGADGRVGGALGAANGTGGALDRLQSVEGVAAGKSGAHLASIERNFLDAKRLSFEQEWLSTDGREALLGHFIQAAQRDGAVYQNGHITWPATQKGVEPVVMSLEEVLQAYGQKWVVERELIEHNVRLIDKRPELGTSLRHHGIDAASLLESVYTHQSSAASNNVRVADALRKTLATPAGADLLPEGWNKDGQRHVGVADLGNGQYAAYLVGHDESGRASEGRLVLLNQSVDASGGSSIRLAGSVPIAKGDMSSLLGGADPDALRSKILDGLKTGLDKRALQDRANTLGLPVTALSAAEVDQAGREADRQVAAFTALNDQSAMSSLARAITQSSTEEGYKKLALGPTHSSILEFPKPSHSAHVAAAARLGSMDVAVNEANHLVHRGIRQFQDLHGISPVAILKRLDSNRKHDEARREFDATRGAFDAPHVRERAKSDLFTARMGRSSRPNDHGPVRINLSDIA